MKRKAFLPMWDKGIQAKGKARQSSQKCQSQRQEFLSSYNMTREFKPKAKARQSSQSQSQSQRQKILKLLHSLLSFYNNNNNSNNNNNNTITKAKICHSFNYFCLTKLSFYLNKWHYRILLIKLLGVLSLQKLQFCLPKRIKNKWKKLHKVS